MTIFKKKEKRDYVHVYVKRRVKTKEKKKVEEFFGGKVVVGGGNRAFDIAGLMKFAMLQKFDTLG